MVDAVETMAWRGEKPWHELGKEFTGILTSDQMVDEAGIGWTVSKRPMYIHIPGPADGPPMIAVEVPGQLALVRDSDNRVMSTVGSRWKPSQNRDAFAFFTSFLTAGGATMETAGSLRGGEYVWGLAKLGSGFEAALGDRVEGYLLLVIPHRGGRSIIARVTTVRVVCWNTLQLALSGQAKFESRFSHSTQFDPHMAAQTLGLARERVVEFAANAALLKKLNLSETEVIAILAPVYEPAARVEEVTKIGRTAMSRTLNGVLDAYYTAPGADPGTGWGVLNAVTFHADHRAGKTGSDDRLTSAWLGTEADRKATVLEKLMAIA